MEDYDKCAALAERLAELPATPEDKVPTNLRTSSFALCILDAVLIQSRIHLEFHFLNLANKWYIEINA